MPADGLLRHPRMCQESHKRGFGYHPLFVFLDETGEALAAKLRPGSAGANTAADHVELLDAAIAQLPVTTKATDPEGGAEVLVRADTAGATHGFVDAIVGHGFEFSIGFDVTEAVRRAILDVPEAAWQVPMDQDMAEREGAGVAEITSYLDLSAWPEGTRAIPTAGATRCSSRARPTPTSSTSKPPTAATPGSRTTSKRPRPSGCCVSPGVASPPTLLGCSSSWSPRTLSPGPRGSVSSASWLAPKRLRYCAWHTAGRLVHTGRRLILRLDAAWPWATELAGAFERLGRLSFAT